MTYRNKHLAIPLAGVLILGLAGTAAAQSSTAFQRANANSAVQSGASKGYSATAKGQDTGLDAIARRRSAPAPSVNAAPVALALQDAGPSPDANPEPLSVVLIGGALAGLYRMRKHLA